jgi:hypothetical protein
MDESGERAAPAAPTRRINSFDRPLKNIQILTWVIFVAILLMFYCFLVHCTWDSTSFWITLALFTICAVGTIVCCYFACSIDPIDDMCLPPEERTVDEQPMERSEMSHCYMCKVSLRKTSKHCGECKKCVATFDHHCVWLNTCIGEKNYKYFLGLVASVQLLTICALALDLAYFIELCKDSVAFHDRISDTFIQIDVIGLWIIVSIMLVFLAGLVAAVAQLAGFHCMLRWRGITTYEYVVSEQRRVNDKRQAEQQAAQRRRLEEQAAATRAAETATIAAEQEMVPV